MVTLLLLLFSTSFSLGGQAESRNKKFSNPNVETALVAFYGIFFIEDLDGHDPVSFFNSEEPNSRLTVDQILKASEGKALEAVIRASVDSLVSRTDSKGITFVTFDVPGGKINYACHSHDNLLQAPENHCTACIGEGSIEGIQLSDDISFSINNRC
jgi:hypothetical protein